MSSKEFCASGSHLYKEIDVVKSIFVGEHLPRVWLITACSKCDSKFLKVIEEPIP